jgi:hypothetical protein
LIPATPPEGVLPELRFRLPGQWWQIPLHGLEEARDSIKKLVSRQVGTADDKAKLRDQLRRQLLQAVEVAIEGNGQSMQVALDVVEEFPIPVSFTVFLPQLQLTPSVGTEGASVISLLQQGLEAAGYGELETAHRFTAHDSEVLRVHRQQLIRSENGEKALPALTADYWLSIPETKRVVLVNFSTALTGIDEVMLTFFDSIVRASHWVRSTVPLMR